MRPALALFLLFGVAARLCEAASGEGAAPSGEQRELSAYEAREYLQEGLWATLRSLYPTAIAALDSAELLGEQAPDLFAVRIRALCEESTRSKEKAVPLLLRALDDLTRYREGHGEAHLELLSRRHVLEVREASLSRRVFLTASELLRSLDERGAAEAETLRTAIRRHAPFAPLRGEFPRTHSIALEYATTWAKSLDEEKAFYTAYISNPQLMQSDRGLLHRQVTPKSFGARFVTEPTERRMAYLEFWRNHDPQSVITLYPLALHADLTEKAAACSAYYELIWRDRAELLRTNRLSAPIHRAFRLERMRELPSADARIIDSLLYYLENVPPTKGSIYHDWNPSLFPEERAEEIWSALQRYQQRMKQVGLREGAFEAYNARILARFPSLIVAGVAEQTLAVTQFFIPKELPEGWLLSSVCADGDELVMVGWKTPVSGEGVVYKVDMQTEKITTLSTPLPSFPVDLVTTDHALWLASSQAREIAGYDSTSGEWLRLPAPEGVSRLYTVGRQIYGILHGGRAAPEDSGIVRFDPQSGEMVLLASSRRRPALNAFDDGEAFRVESIFPGPEGRAYASINSRIYELGEQSERWPFADAPGNVRQVFRQRNETLVLCSSRENPHTGALYVIRPDHHEPELLLGTITPHWEDFTPLPRWTAASRWKAGKPPRVDPYHYGMYREHLIGVACDQQRATLSLTVYCPGKSDPVRLRLRFEMQADAAARLKALGLSPHQEALVKNPPSFGHPEICFHSSGIAIRAIYGGFWQLPYRDLFTHLKSVCTPLD